MKAYSRSFEDPRRAREYREKFRKGLFRRWTHLKEEAHLESALALVSAWGRLDLVLDVPCGAGRWTSLLRRAGGRYLGVDLSLPMLRVCREAEGIQGRLVQASAWALPLEDREADLAACLRLLHHVREEEGRRALVRELCRVAERALLLTFLDGDSPKQWLHRKKGRLLGRPLRRPTWTRGALEETAREGGFELVRYWPLSPWFSGQTLALFRREAQK